MSSRTYWYTKRDKNKGTVWAGRIDKQFYVNKNGVCNSFFEGHCLHIHDNEPCGLYMRHRTYRAACDHAGIRPVRIKWGGAPHPKV